MHSGANILCAHLSLTNYMIKRTRKGFSDQTSHNLSAERYLQLNIDTLLSCFVVFRFRLSYLVHPKMSSWYNNLSHENSVGLLKIYFDSVRTLQKTTVYEETESRMFLHKKSAIEFENFYRGTRPKISTPVAGALFLNVSSKFIMMIRKIVVLLVVYLYICTVYFTGICTV